MADEAQGSASQIDVVRALRDAAWAGLIAFGLLLPLIGFNTVQNIRNELVLETRWPLLIALVAVIAIGRLLWGVLPHHRLRRGLRAFVASPRKLAAMAVACWLIAVLARTTHWRGRGGACRVSHVAHGDRRPHRLDQLRLRDRVRGRSGHWRATRPPRRRAGFAGTRSETRCALPRLDS